MNLHAHYDEMRAAALRQLGRGEAELDALIDSPHDERRGITLLARPPARITEIIAAMLADFQRAEPNQYYYPAAEIHLTILSIISCYNKFTLDLINSEEYIGLVNNITRRASPFKIRYEGLTASPGGIIVQGFPEDDGLENLREQVRKAFRASGLQQSIDHRYSIQTAHSTVIRFRKPIANTALLLQNIEKYRERLFGSFEVDEVELVYNDWYQRTANTIVLEKYKLSDFTPPAWNC